MTSTAPVPSVPATPPAMPVVLHSYSLRDYSREHVFEVVREGGWTHVELAAIHLNAGAAQEDLALAVAQADAAGARIHCVGYWGQFADLGEARRDTVERARSVIEACAVHGITLVNGSGGWLVHDPEPERWNADWRANGSAIATAADYERVADAYRELADLATPLGVRINIEIHPNTVHDTAAATARLLALIDRPGVAVTVDPSNAAALSEADRDPGVLDLLGDRATYFHVKNCTVAGGVADFNTDVDRGLVDNDRWLAAMAGSGRCSGACVEYCGDSDPHPYLTASRSYLGERMQGLAATGAAA